MRTEGTFQDVYEAAKEYCMGGGDGCPMNPVIRHKKYGKWALESGHSSPHPDNDFECTLEVFDTYFYEGYKDNNCVINDVEIEDFIKAF